MPVIRKKRPKSEKEMKKNDSPSSHPIPFWVAWFIGILLISSAVMAEEKIQPYILSSQVKGDFVKTVIEVKEALEGAGFEIAGEYSPYQDAHVIVVTNDDLRELAQQLPGGAFMLGQRVAVSRLGEEIQVSYANPEYYRHAYRIDSPVAAVSSRLREVLGSQQPFGSTGLGSEELRGYHYSYGMEYFSDFLELARHGNYENAVRAVEGALDNNGHGAGMVYRVDMPFQKVSVFGISLGQGFSSDAKVMATLDVGPLRHTARLPYEIVVHRGRVFAMHPRFRIALDFPSMKMVGKNSFMSLTQTPTAIEKILKIAAGAGS
jgi:hypothetical protein